MPSFFRIVAALTVAFPAWAHFQVLVPSTDCVESPAERSVFFDIRFTHPMAGGPVMAMGGPMRFGVVARGENIDLTGTLKARTLEGQPAYTATYEFRQPGAHVFYLEPSPYYEPDETTYIIHYTKVVVDAFNSWSGWDAMVGFPVEIRPLTRPYGFWCGNSFQGMVMKDGKPVPFATVEVERLNDDGALAAPNPTFETQMVTADANGSFTYTVPASGWWGFAALLEGDTSMKTPEGEPADVELGALMWIFATPVSFTPAKKEQ